MNDTGLLISHAFDEKGIDNIRPIEVKSGKNYTLSSLTKCQNKFREYITTPTVLHAADY